MQRTARRTPNSRFLSAIEQLEQRQLLHGGEVYAAINFQPSGSTVPQGFLADTGATYANRGNGFSYGWNKDNSGTARDRNLVSDQSLDTLQHMQIGGSAVWEISVPNGVYGVQIAAGDPGYDDSVYRINAEGTLALSGNPNRTTRSFVDAADVTVTDGKLTISNASGAQNNKIQWIVITTHGDHGGGDPDPTPSGLYALNVNFQPANVAVPTGFIVDSGKTYGDRGDGNFFGWDTSTADYTRDRNATSDQARDTLVHTMIGGNRKWEAAVPNGVYDVTISAGDSAYWGARHSFDAEGVNVVNAYLTSSSRFVEGTQRVTVSDGRLTITAGAGAENNKINFVKIQQIDTGGPVDPPPPTGSVKALINFQPSGAPVPGGYFADTGATYADRGNGLTYGWNTNITADARDRGVDSDQRYDTLVHMMLGGDAKWEMAVPNGTYTVRVVGGDPGYYDTLTKIAVEGVIAVNAQLTSSSRFAEGTVTVNVTDGRLTISNASGAQNNKISFVEIVSGSVAFPVVGISAIDSSASEDGDTGTFRFSRSGDTSAAVTIGYTIGGKATNGSDYQSIAGSITIPAGQSSVDLVITPIDDSAVEGNETVTLVLTSATNASLPKFGEATITIKDNDSSTPGSQPTGVTWSNISGWPIPAPRTEAQTAAINGKMYYIGGFDDNFVPHNTAAVWDPSSNTWEALPNAPKAITHAGVAVNGTDIWLAGGYVGSSNGGQIFGTTEVFIFDTVSKSWKSGPSLPVARAAGGLAKVGNLMIYTGGQNISRTVDQRETWAYDLTNPGAGWVQKASIPQSRNHPGVAVLNGKMYVLGGQTGYDDGLTTYRDIFEYNPTTNAWTTLALKLPEGRSHIANSTFVYKDRIYIIGGEQAHITNNSKTVWAVDINAGSVTSLNNMPRSRISPAAVVINDTFYVWGGYDGGLVFQAIKGTLLY